LERDDAHFGLGCAVAAFMVFINAVPRDILRGLVLLKGRLNGCDRIADTCRRLELTSFAIVPVRIIRSPNFGILAAILVGGALATATTPSLAEMRVRGSPEAVRIEARDSSVAEILSALSSAFNMRYQSSANLDKRLSGTYTGPLSRVLARILDGYNFVVKTDNGTLAVTVLGPPNGGAAPAASSAVRVVPAGGDAAQARSSADDLARPPISASAAAPSPAREGAEPPPFPTPARPSSGAAPAPVPEPPESQAAAPAPPVLGSKASPAPEPGRPADTPPAPPIPQPK
jgi:hypothetical protein